MIVAPSIQLIIFSLSVTRPDNLIIKKNYLQIYFITKQFKCDWSDFRILFTFEGICNVINILFILVFNHKISCVLNILVTLKFDLKWSNVTKLHYFPLAADDFTLYQSFGIFGFDSFIQMEPVS
ncbi:hypothetical protein FGO68_gene6862 [Halteria grandinella]|uniref:Uncharacterized protein n=1 Tax=Halteria grandinella TaxID=5974 RepID=A0A8J8NB51_HALGN|nr:hypothetical protein FGO68_gene6862 [Halteria grandinella]